MAKEPRKRHRSPAYPSLALPDAVEKCRSLFQHEKRNAFDPDVALAHWGYEPGSANGMRAVAALKQYGLLTEQRGEGDRELTLTELAIDVLMPEEEGSEEHYTALQHAALSPKLFEEIWSRHANSGLPSDRNLERYLIKEKDFNPGVVSRIVRCFRETLTFAGLEAGDTIRAGGLVENVDNEAETSPKPAWQASLFPGFVGTLSDTPAHKKMASHASMLELPLTLPSLKIAILRVPAEMSEQDFTTLIDSLNAWKKALVMTPDKLVASLGVREVGSSTAPPDPS